MLVQCIDSLVILSIVIHLIKAFSRLKFRPIFKIPHTVEGQMQLTCHKLWLHVKSCTLFLSFSHWKILLTFRVSLSCYLNDVWAYRTNAGVWQVTDSTSKFTETSFVIVFVHTCYDTLQTACLCPKILLLWTLEEIRKHFVSCKSIKHNAKE
jgi:hypothetical protein